MSIQSNENRAGWRRVLPLALVVVFASSALLQEHLGLWAIGLHFLIVMGGFLLAERVLPCLPQTWTPWLALTVFAGLVIIFTVVYPIEHGRGPGQSSDRDDALNIAVARVLDGESPYYPRSDRAGPLSLFPGAILLAMPFAVSGNSAWQNLFWLPAFFLLSGWLWKSRESALVWIVALLATSPAMQHEFVSGGDMLANSIYIPCASLFLLSACGGRFHSGWLPIAAAVFFGLALTSRPNFAFVFPLVMAGVVARLGWKPSLLLGGISVLTAALLTLPFYLRDPQGFTPLSAGNKLSLLDRTFPHASLWLAGATGMAAVLGVRSILRRPPVEMAIIWKWCAVVVLLPMAGAVLLRSFSEGRPDFVFMHDRYGLMPMFFACWGWISRPKEADGGN